MAPTPKQYNKMSQKAAPNSKLFRNMLVAFLVGGLICTLGQGIMSWMEYLNLPDKDAGAITSISLVFLSALLTGLNCYDDIAKHAGAGTLVPITGFANTRTKPEDYDMILTGDLGQVGSTLLLELLQQEKIDIKKQHQDCGLLIYDREAQDVHAGGSGCGCAASVLCSFILPQIKSGVLKDVLFIATGALMSPTATLQGESIPGIAHLVHLSHTCRRKGVE